MKRLFLILALAFLCPVPALAITGDDSRFDWSSGQPAVTADNTNTCNDTARVRFDWSMGQPAVVHDATANCTAAAPGGDVAEQELFIIIID
jgi:hypothetical protein